jgi:hypothetical protein
MSHAQKIQLENLAGLERQQAYSSDVLINRINEMEDWEVKEYIAVHLDTLAEYNSLYLHVKNNF